MRNSLDRARFAAIFVSQRSHTGQSEYSEAAERMLELARRQPGFVDFASARDPLGLGITVSYWESLEAIRDWGRHAEHQEIQRQGRERWYEWFDLAVVELRQVRQFQRGSLENEAEDIQRDHQQHEADDKQ